MIPGARDPNSGVNAPWFADAVSRPAPERSEMMRRHSWDDDAAGDDSARCTVCGVGVSDDYVLDRFDAVTPSTRDAALWLYVSNPPPSVWNRTYHAATVDAVKRCPFYV